MREKSLMIPILFNSVANKHGRSFVRFPEELSGFGCYDTVILRILIGIQLILILSITQRVLIYLVLSSSGSGYTLKWSKHVYSHISEHNATSLIEDSGCLHSQEWQSYRDALVSFDRLDH